MVTRTKAKVKKVERLSQSVINIYLIPENRFQFNPGQFVIVQVEIDGKPIRRSYSIASSPKEDGIVLCIKQVKGGKVSPFLHELEINHEVLLIGPAGHFFVNDKTNPIILIGSGTGIAPLRSMAVSQAGKRNITIISGQRNSGEEIFSKELEELAKKYSNFKYVSVKSREETKFKGYVQDHVKEFLQNDADYYICGLKDMVLGTIKKLEELGIERKNIHFERYD